MGELLPKKAIFRLAEGILLSDRQQLKLELSSLLIRVATVDSYRQVVSAKGSHKVWASGGHEGEEK